MTKLAPEWVQTNDPVIRSPARYRRTTSPALMTLLRDATSFLSIFIQNGHQRPFCFFPIDANNHRVLVIWNINGYGEYEFDWCICDKVMAFTSVGVRRWRIFDFIECFTTTFLRAHSWLNWVDEDDDEHDEVGLKEKPEDTRYIKKITSK